MLYAALVYVLDLRSCRPAARPPRRTRRRGRAGRSGSRARSASLLVGRCQRVPAADRAGVHRAGAGLQRPHRVLPAPPRPGGARHHPQRARPRRRTTSCCPTRSGASSTSCATACGASRSTPTSARCARAAACGWCSPTSTTTSCCRSRTPSGPELTAQALEFRRIVGPPENDARQEVYLCHNFCELGALEGPATCSSSSGGSSSATRPRCCSGSCRTRCRPSASCRCSGRSGLDRYLATIDWSEPLPTLGTLISSGQRLIVGLENGDLGPTIPNAFRDGVVQEVPYNYRSVDELTAARLVPPVAGPARRADLPVQPLGHPGVGERVARGQHRGGAGRAGPAVHGGARAAAQPRGRRLLRAGRPVPRSSTQLNERGGRRGAG